MITLFKQPPDPILWSDLMKEIVKPGIQQLEKHLLMYRDLPREREETAGAFMTLDSVTGSITATGPIQLDFVQRMNELFQSTDEDLKEVFQR